MILLLFSSLNCTTLIAKKTSELKIAYLSEDLVLWPERDRVARQRAKAEFGMQEVAPEYSRSRQRLTPVI